MDKGNPYVLLREHKLVQPPPKSVQRLLNYLKIDLPYEPAMTLLGIYPSFLQADMSQGCLGITVYCSTVHDDFFMEPT